jgi:hypothetical protein
VQYTCVSLVQISGAPVVGANPGIGFGLQVRSGTARFEYLMVVNAPVIR